MALQLPKGLYNVGVAVLDATTEVPGTLISNFYPRSLSPSYANDTFDIQGGDVLLEQGEFNERYEMNLETAGIPMAALAMFEGVTNTTTGSGATLITFMKKNVTANPRPYFRLRAQQKDKSGGSTVYWFYRSTLSGSPTFGMSQGEYQTPQIPIVATPATVAVTGPPVVAVNDLYQVEQQATYGALA